MKTYAADRMTLIGLELFMGVMAVACGVILAGGFAGTVLDMQTNLLDGTPFGSFLIPGIILALVVGGSQFLAAYGLWRHEPWGMTMSVTAGAILMGWIAGEVILLSWIAPHGLQPFCFAYGAIVTLFALPHARERERQR